MANTGYRDGYEKGRSQAQRGDDRDERPAGLGPTIKALVSETYLSGHMQGVKDGYRDEMMTGNTGKR